MFKNKLFPIVLALFLAVFALGGAMNVSAAAQNGGLTVLLTANPSAFNAAQDVVVQVTISNSTNRPQKVLKWFTPAEDVEESLFAVSRGGQAVSYLGPIYKRPAVKGDDYLTLKAGEEIVRSVNLSAYYDFSATGVYTLRYDVSSYQLHNEKANTPWQSLDRLTSNEVVVWVEGRSAAVPSAVTPDAVTGTTAFNKCTTTQKSTLNSARAQASTYSNGALLYLTANTQTPRYTTWFGAYDSSRYNIVKTNFSKISGAMDTAAVTFDCGCKKQYYAYVYPTRPYVIYLCKVFWTAPMTGTDSKAGTLIHEMSHFTVVAGTDDYVYGQTGAKTLAISNPAQAVDNADNHEYFAENTPALP